MRLQTPFAALSPTGLDAQVLTVLARSNHFLTVSEIHALLPDSGSLQGVRNSVLRLVEQGTCLERATGRNFAYALNRDHLLADAITQIARSKSALMERIAKEIASWNTQPTYVSLFGSAARGDMQESSDIDILFVFPDSAPDEDVDAQIPALAAQATLWTGNDVRPLMYRESEVEPAGVLDSVMREGVMIFGEPSWLADILNSARGQHGP